MTFYSTLQSKAAALLAKFGQDVTLRKLTAGAYDPDTGTASPSSSDTVLKGALFDFDAGQAQRDQTIIQLTDKQVLLAAGGAVPSPDDLVIAGGVQYALLAVKEINPAGTPVLYDCHARRS